MNLFSSAFGLRRFHSVTHVVVLGARQHPRDRQQHPPKDGVVFFQLFSAHLRNAKEDHGGGVERHHCHRPQQREGHHTLGTPWLRSPSPPRKLLTFLQGHDVAGLSCRTIEQAPHHLVACSRGATAAATSNPSCPPSDGPQFELRDGVAVPGT